MPFKRSALSVVGILLAFVALFPLTLYAAVPDPQAGRNWSCDITGARTTGAGQETTTTCRPPAGTGVWEQTCTVQDEYDANGAPLPGGGSGANNFCTTCQNLEGGTITNRSQVKDGGQCVDTHSNVVAGATHTETVDKDLNVIKEDSNPVGDTIVGLTLGALGELVSWILQIFMMMLAGILAFVSWVFDWIAAEFVVGMGKYITSPSAGAVREAWTLIRDLANIGIIGGLVATAIGTIVQAKSYNVQATLARLILAALLVNFSYFFAGAIIDFSNFTARAAYEYTVRDTSCEQALLKDKNGSCGPAGRFFKATSLGAIFEGDSVFDHQASDTKYSGTQAMAYSVMQIIFLCVTTFVFLAAIALLVGRFVVLIFLLITSPIGIAGPAIPILKNYADEWWKALWSQTFFAPVYFILVGISLSLIEVLRSSLLLRNTTKADFIGTIAMFAVSIGFMWAALEIARKMSGEAGRFKPIYDIAGKAFGWASKGYVGGVRYAGGIALRDTIGFGAHKAGEAYRKFAAKNELATFDKFKKVPLVGGVMDAAVRGSDRALSDFLHKTSDKEFIKGVPGYEKTKHAKFARQALLGEVKREEEQLQKYKDASHKAEHKEKTIHKEQEEGKQRVGESDENYWGRQRLRDLKLKKADGKLETDEEALRRLGKSYGDLAVFDAKAKKFRGKTFEELSADGRLKDKMNQKYGADGKLVADTLSDKQLKDKIESGLGRKGRVNEKGEYIAEDIYDYEERLDKAEGLLFEDNVSFRDARAAAGAIFDTFTNDFIKRKYEEEPDIVVELAKWAPYDKFKMINDDKSIRRDLRDKMAAERWGKFAREVLEIQKDVDDGKIIEFGEEYNKRMILPYQYMQNNMKAPGEFEDFLRSTGTLVDEHGKPLEGTAKIGVEGKPLKFEDLRKMRAMQHAYSTSTFVDIKDKKIFDPTEQRNMSSDKRKSLTNMRDEWTAIQIAKGYEDNDWIVPNMGGTTNYIAAKRARDTVTKELKTLQAVVTNSPIEAERERARARVAYLERLSQEGGAIQAELRAKGLVTPAQRDQYYVERKKALKTMSAEDRSRELAAAAEPGGSALDQMLDREIILEGGYDPTALTGIPSWYEGKNSEKELGVLGKREAVSPALIKGLDVTNFRAIYNSGFDKVEKDRFWQNMLIYGSEETLKNILESDYLRQFVSLPTGELYQKLNEERVRLMGAEASLDQFK